MEYETKLLLSLRPGHKERGTANYGALELHVCRNVLVIGKGKPHHVTEAQATNWVHRGKAVWQKQGRRIKYTAGKRSPIVRAATIGERNILRSLGAPLTPGERVSAALAAYEHDRIELYPEVACCRKHITRQRAEIAPALAAAPRSS
jgi:hypothetical protein